MVWLQLTSRGDSLQSVRTSDTGRLLFLVAICAAALGIYSYEVALSIFCTILALDGEARSNNLAQYSGPIELFVLL